MGEGSGASACNTPSNRPLVCKLTHDHQFYFKMEIYRKTSGDPLLWVPKTSPPPPWFFSQMNIVLSYSVTTFTGATKVKLNCKKTIHFKWTMPRRPISLTQDVILSSNSNLFTFICSLCNNMQPQVKNI